MRTSPLALLLVLLLGCGKRGDPEFPTDSSDSTEVVAFKTATAEYLKEARACAKLLESRPSRSGAKAAEDRLEVLHSRIPDTPNAEVKRLLLRIRAHAESGVFWSGRAEGFLSVDTKVANQLYANDLPEYAAKMRADVEAVRELVWGKK